MHLKFSTTEIVAVLINRSYFRLHFYFALPAVVLTVAGVGWWIAESLAHGRLVGGGSASGLACGVAAGSIIAFEMLLWPRKIFRRLRLIPAKFWMAAHIWFGLASLPLAVAHCGLHWGGWLPASLLALFILTIISGIYGVAIQNVLPKWMLRNLPAETIYSQIDHVSGVTIEDAKLALTAACGRRPGERANRPVDVEKELMPASAESIVIGAMRGAGKTRGRSLISNKMGDLSKDAAALWTAFDGMKSYLAQGRAASTPLATRAGMEQYFRSVRSVCGSESEPIIALLESYCDQRRQFDVQRSCQHWLHAWLPVHIGLSVAVSVLLAIHVYTALKYW